MSEQEQLVVTTPAPGKEKTACVICGQIDQAGVHDHTLLSTVLHTHLHIDTHAHMQQAHLLCKAHGLALCPNSCASLATLLQWWCQHPHVLICGVGWMKETGQK